MRLQGLWTLGTQGWLVTSRILVLVPSKAQNNSLPHALVTQGYDLGSLMHDSGYSLRLPSSLSVCVG